MISKIGKKPEGVSFPVWAWAKWQARDKKIQDFEAEERKNSVIFEIEIPDEKVLLSDFDAWDSVLYHSYISLAKDEDTFYKENEEVDSLPQEAQERRIVESWDNIFNVEFYASSHNLISYGEFVQATFWELHIKDIIKYYIFDENGHLIKAQNCIY